MANGEYKEYLTINNYITLLGLSRDSTILNGSNLFFRTIKGNSDFEIQNFKILGQAINGDTYGISNIFYNTFIKNCTIENCNIALSIGESSGIVDQVFVRNCHRAVYTFCGSDTCRPQILNSVFLVSDGLAAIGLFDGGNPIVQNNIVIGHGGYSDGISTAYTINSAEIKNNIIAQFFYALDLFNTDTARTINNVFGYRTDINNRGYIIKNSKNNFYNNIIFNTDIGLSSISNNRDYNLYWNNAINILNDSLNEHEIEANPMFVKDDSIPNHQFNFDYHLQKYSPAIDAGDPAILDKDSSRSDIGYLGGPGGLSYTYLDLPPSAPKGLSISKDTNNITIKWRKNSESDFSQYRLFRDTVINFTVDSTKLITELTDTSYTHIIPPGVGQFYYRLTAVDSQGNESELSEQAGIILTGVDEWEMVSEYNLFQNYPNPFNPKTIIPYRLKERGYIRLMIYDIKGELIKVLVNEEKEKGYYEEEFRAEGLSSGIYLYRIEIIGKGRIPVYSDMRKMILLK